jgi:putative CocE/NonD family hydrolase
MMMDYIHDQEASRNSDMLWKSGVYDNYDLYLRAGSAGELGRRMKMEHLDMWRKLLQHPSYDAFWQAQAVDKILADQPLKVPILYVHGLWDQEDIYGAVAAYQAVEPKDRENDMNFLVMGPWSHSGSNGDGSSLGPLRFDGNTARYFRQTILLPFLNEHLKAGAAKANTPPVLVYETGSDDWKRYDSWPLSCESGCAGNMRAYFLRKGFGLGFDAPDAPGDAFDEYISDPSKPVPYRLRPIRPTYAEDSNWERWLVDDQRNFSTRTDVLSYQSETLTRPVAIGGRPVANLFASTTGTDSDFVLKLIDVYPDEYPSQPELGGYQLMVSAEILRGRYRTDKAKPAPISAGRVELFRWELPPAHHVFLPGHKIMVQIQSSWFPLYDRNPQTYVENIFWAKPTDFIKATQRIYRAGDHASFIALPVMP